MTSYARPTPKANAGVISVAVHGLLIAGAVSGTLPSESLLTEGLANRVYYIPPVEKPPLALGTRETVRYITMAPGLGVGPGPSSIDDRRPIGLLDRTPVAGEAPVDSTPPVAAQEPIGDPKGDSVFTVLEVDSAVVRSQSSAAPAYPLPLLEKHVEGAVIARYVVDTTGFADPGSLEVVSSTHAGFVQAVKDALPYMRFTPAKIGPLKVKQLVEQSFTFRIAPPTPTPGAKP